MPINQYIDHTLLKPWVTSKHIIALCKETKFHGFRSVCVNPCYIRLARRFEIKVSSVVDYPLGVAPNKLDLARQAVDWGADELDVVWDLASFKDKEYLNVMHELAKIVELCVPVKVIVETCFLNASEQETAYQIVKDSGAWCIKTSTGMFNPGATIETIILWNSLGDLKIKASGGIETFYMAQQLILAGADIIGTSKGLEMLE